MQRAYRSVTVYQVDEQHLIRGESPYTPTLLPGLLPMEECGPTVRS